MTTATEKEIFDRFVNLLTEVEVLNQDLKAFKGDITYHKDHNPSGYSKDEVKVLLKAAKLAVKEAFEAFDYESKAVIEKYKSVTGYNN